MLHVPIFVQNWFLIWVYLLVSDMQDLMQSSQLAEYLCVHTTSLCHLSSYVISYVNLYLTCKN